MSKRVIYLLSFAQEIIEHVYVYIYVKVVGGPKGQNDREKDLAEMPKGMRTRFNSKYISQTFSNLILVINYCETRILIKIKIINLSSVSMLDLWIFFNHY